MYLPDGSLKRKFSLPKLSDSLKQVSECRYIRKRHSLNGDETVNVHDDDQDYEDHHHHHQGDDYDRGLYDDDMTMLANHNQSPTTLREFRSTGADDSSNGGSPTALYYSGGGGHDQFYNFNYTYNQNNPPQFYRRSSVIGVDSRHLTNTATPVFEKSHRL